MSTKTQKKTNKFEIAEIEEDFRQYNNDNDSVDRARMSWILNLLLNQKTQQEVAKDIIDGILDFKEVEEMFPWNFVQELRQCTPEIAQNYLNRFKNMTDDRMKGLLNALLSRKSRGDMITLITDRTLGLDKIQKSYLWSHVVRKGNKSSPTASNVSTSSEKDPIDIGVKDSKEAKDTGTKKKRNTVKKSEKESDTKQKETESEKKVVNELETVKSKEKLSVQEPPAMMMENHFENAASSDSGKSLIHSRHEGFEESSLKSQGDRHETSSSASSIMARCDTKKTTKSKSLASDGETKLAGAKKASKKIGKDVKPRVRNKGKPLKSSNDHIEKWEKSKADESDGKNENENEKVGASLAIEKDHLPETGNAEGLENILPKSRLNQIASNISFLKDGEQDIRGSKEDEARHVPEYNFNIQLNTSTPKKLNCESKMIRIKEEPRSECSFKEFDYPIEREKLLNGCEDFCKKEDYSCKKLPTKSAKKISNTEAKPSKALVTKSKKFTEPSKKIAKSEKHYDDAKEENTGKRTKDRKERKDVNKVIKSYEHRRIDKKEQKSKEKIRRREKKMQKAMTKFSGEVVRLVKDMGYLESSEESDETSFSCCCSEESSDESSFSSSSESCSCSSCCNSSSSYEYSEYTLCTCSNCGSSSSSYSDTDSDEINEE